MSTYYTKLTKEEAEDRLDKLSWLIYWFEGHESGTGHNIWQKAYKAYNKVNDFTGIIRLTKYEKEFISYMLDSKPISKKEIEIIRFYSKINDKQWEEILQFDEYLKKVWEEEEK